MPGPSAKDLYAVLNARFAQGGEVTNDDYIQEMMTGTRPADQGTSPGLLPPELRRAIDVPLDLANMAVRGMGAAVAGPMYGLYKGITSDKYGTPEGVKEASSEAGKMMQRITGEPKTETGRDVMDFIGRQAEALKLAPTPQLLTLPVPGPGAASALMRSYELAETPPIGAVKLPGKEARPPVDSMGFYSPTEQVVMNLPQERGTAQQMLAQISKAPGVKPVELRATGLEEYLKGKGNAPVTRQEIQDFLRNNPVQVDEVVLGKGQVLSPEAKRRMAEAEDRMIEIDNQLAPYFENTQRPDTEPYSTYFRLRGSLGRKAAAGDAEAMAEIDALNLPPDIKQLVLEFAEQKNEYKKYSRQARKMVKPQFDRYNIPGGENAREIYLTLPGRSERDTAQAALDAFTSRVTSRLGRTGWDFESMTPQELAEYERLNNAALKAATEKPSLYTVPSAHRVNPEADTNRLAHIFVDDRMDAQGNKTLFVQELQSDWAQQGRERGFKTSPDPIALEAAKNKVSQTEQALRQKFEELFNRGERAQDHPERLAVLEQVAQAREELQRLTQDSRLPPAPFVSTQKYRVMKDGKELITKNKEGKEVRHVYDNPETAQAAAQKFGGQVEDMGMQENTEGWLNLALKRVIKEAIDSGADNVAFIKGEQAAKKYSLGTVLDSIEVMPLLETRFVDLKRKGGGAIELTVDNKGNVVQVDDERFFSQFVNKPLSEIIGKEMAEKAMAVKPSKGKESVQFDAESMEVGGQGMKGFYDNILPKTAEKLLKRLGGGKVETIELEKEIPSRLQNYASSFMDWMSTRHPEISSEDAARAWAMGMDNNEFVKEYYEATSPVKYLGFKITPEMREMVKTQGLPKFAAGGEVTQFIKAHA